MTRVFDVDLHGQTIGVLRESDDGFVAFSFNDRYRAMRPRPVLGQAFIDDPERAYVGKRRELPPFFANLVPEGELRPFLERQLGIERGDDLALLEVVGHDLPGAVRVRRRTGSDTGGEAEDTGTIGPRDLAGMPEELRFSLAGIQLKFSVVRAQDKVTLPLSGSRGDWILKLDSERFAGVVENEYTMLKWAEAAGFDVPECALVGTTTLGGLLADYGRPGVNALLVRRYDRGDVVVHQEDFAQVLNARPVNKYANISYEGLAVLVEGIVGPAGLDEFLRRLVFVVASGNADAHLKNWSLIYPDRINATLAPLYDQVATVAWPELATELALKLVGVRRFEHVRESTFEVLAETLGRDQVATLRLVQETLDGLLDAWQALLDRGLWSIPPEHTRALVEHWTKVPLLATRKPPLRV